MNSHEDIFEVINKHDIVLSYFSHEGCSVCKVLKPKIEQLIREKYNKTEFIYIDTNKLREIAGQMNVFTVPVVILFCYGKESVRWSRNISMHDLDEKLSRIYRFLR